MSQESPMEGGWRLSEPVRPPRSQPPVISVVTVVLNGNPKLERTIESVLSQSLERFEYIVIDGGSGDGTVDILKKYNDRIDYWRSEPDHGISDAFNKGIKLAQGALVGLLNAGDWYEQGALLTVFEAYQSDPESDVFCGGIGFWTGKSQELRCQSNPGAIDRGTSIYHPTVLVKREAYLKHGGFDVGFRLAMDYELLLRLSRKGARFHNIQKKLVNMTLDGISTEKWYEGLKEVRRARAKYFSSSNVAYHHTLALVKNLVARGLKAFGLGSAYRAYWQLRNARSV